MSNIIKRSTDILFDDIKKLINSAKASVFTAVNTGQTLLYWQVGKRINEDVLKGDRAEYGKQIVVTLSRQLSWSHLVAIIPIKGKLQREFYTEMCRIEG